MMLAFSSESEETSLNYWTEKILFFIILCPVNQDSYTLAKIV